MHSAWPTFLDTLLSLYWLQNHFPTFRKGSLRSYWPLPEFKKSLGSPWRKTFIFSIPWDPSETALCENTNHQKTHDLIFLFCNGTYLGRSREKNLAPKTTGPWFRNPRGADKARRNASQEAPRDVKDAKPIVFFVKAHLLRAFLWRTCHFWKISDNIRNINVLHHAFPFGLISAMSRALLGPFNFVHASPSTSKDVWRTPPAHPRSSERLPKWFVELYL